MAIGGPKLSPVDPFDESKGYMTPEEEAVAKMPHAELVATVARLQERVEEAERALALKAVVMVSGEMVTKAEYEAVKALAERRKEALEPFAEVYGRSSKLVRGTRGMSSVPLRHRVVLLSEQSDGSFGYLAIKVFRDARAAIEEGK
jgi:hypothetical protein